MASSMKEPPPEMRDVCKFLKSRSSQWYEIGNALHVPFEILDDLANKPITDNIKRDRVINKWLQSWCSPPTWDNFIEVLERLELRAAATDVTKFLTTDPEAIKKYNWKSASERTPAVPSTDPSHPTHREARPIDKSVVKTFSDKIKACVEHYNSKKPRGIIFIVGIVGTHGAPDGTDKDVKNVESTFENPNMNFAVLTTQNPTSDKLTALIAAASEYTDYPPSYEFFSFYFAGHGGTDKDGRPFVIASDPERVFIEQKIIEPLRNIRIKICLFFFDCCLSNSARGESSDPSLRKERHRGEVVAYAVSKGQAASGDSKKGGVWTQHLCVNILKPDPIVNVLAKTNGEVFKVNGQTPLTVSNVDNTVIICKAGGIPNNIRNNPEENVSNQPSSTASEESFITAVDGRKLSEAGGEEPDAKRVCNNREENVSNQPSSTASEELFITAVDGRKLSASSDSNLDDLLEAIISVSDWKSLGLKLKLKKYQLENIDDKNRGKVKDCQSAMISLWLDTGNASWRALVRALASPLVGKRGLAVEIAEKHPICQLN